MTCQHAQTAMLYRSIARLTLGQVGSSTGSSIASDISRSNIGINALEDCITVHTVVRLNRCLLLHAQADSPPVSCSTVVAELRALRVFYCCSQRWKEQFKGVKSIDNFMTSFNAALEEALPPVSASLDEFCEDTVLNRPDTPPAPSEAHQAQAGVIWEERDCYLHTEYYDSIVCGGASTAACCSGGQCIGVGSDTVYVAKDQACKGKTPACCPSGKTTEPKIQ